MRLSICARARTSPQARSSGSLADARSHLTHPAAPSTFYLGAALLERQRHSALRNELDNQLDSGGYARIGDVQRGARVKELRHGLRHGIARCRGRV